MTKQPTDPEYIKLTKDKPEQPHPCNYVNFKKAESSIAKPELETLDYKPEPEQPNPNAMVFEQIDGCCDIINKLLKELEPQTESVWCCQVTHDIWRDNDLKRLKGAFE